MSFAELLVSGFGKVIVTCYAITHFDLELNVLLHVLVAMRDVSLHRGLEAITVLYPRYLGTGEGGSDI